MREKQGRNDPCPCGSGKKFKKCCYGRPPSSPAVFTDESPFAELRELSLARRRCFAAYAVKMFPDLLHRLDLLRETPGLLDFYKTHVRSLFHYYENAPADCSVLQTLDEKISTLLTDPEDPRDPVVMLEAGLPINLVLASYPAALDPAAGQRAVDIIQAALRALVVRTAAAVGNQVERLRSAVDQSASFLETFNDRCRPRVVLIELPIGNSIPTKLLDRELQSRTIRTLVVRVSLSRNDSAQHGVTRKEILARAFQEAGVGPEDVVVYVDEWLTGSNFHNISQYLAKLVRRFGAPFLPVALLTENAAHDARFETRFKPAHDRLCAAIGAAGERFRHTFPPLESRHTSEAYFFWGERDWMAGYRKIQQLGSLFSVLDRTVEHLRRSPEALEDAKHAIVDHFIMSERPDQEIGGLLLGFIGEGDHFSDFFERSYQVYVRQRPELEARFRQSPLCWGTEDALSAHDEAVRILTGQLNQNLAAICMMAAVLYFMYRLESCLEDYDRFFFRAHAPAILELDGSRRALHEHWMDVLTQRATVFASHVTRPEPDS